jgi:hypothetical protein
LELEEALINRLLQLVLLLRLDDDDNWIDFRVSKNRRIRNWRLQQNPRPATLGREVNELRVRGFEARLSRKGQIIRGRT